MTKKEKEKLKRLLRRHVKAQIDLTWKGSKDPADWGWYELEAREASSKLFKFIEEIKE